MARIERKLAAIMLADIAGYSALMEANESRTFERARALREDLINPTVARYGGRVVKTTGDGFLAEFSTGSAALLCGIDIQRANHARETRAPEKERIHLRIGINLGDIIVDGDDVSGDGVNVAARLEPLAPKDGICVSGAVRDQVREDLDVVFEDLGDQAVKNIKRPIRAYRINLANATVPTPAVRRGRKFREPMIAAAVAALLVIGSALYWYRDKQDPAPLPPSGASVAQRGEFAGIRITSALVIGNARYSVLDKLPNVVNDAIAISTALKLQGVPVTLKLDLTDLDLQDEIEKFRNQSTDSSVMLFYYAGHGWNFKGKNVLLPINSPTLPDLESGKGLDKLSPVTEIYRNIPGKMLVLLDTHGEPAGVPDNVVLTFSGSTTMPAFEEYKMPDGSDSRHSPYTASIVEMLSGTDTELAAAFMNLAQRTGKKTNGAQIPWVSPSIVGAKSWSAGRIER